MLDPKANPELNILKEINCPVELTAEEIDKVNQCLLPYMCPIKKATLAYAMEKRSDESFHPLQRIL